MIGLEPGGYRLEMLVPGYVPARFESVSLSAGDYLTDLTIELNKGRTLRGAVKDSQDGIQAPVKVMARRVGDGIRLEQSGPTRTGTS